MALLNRSLTEDEVRRMVADFRRDWPAIPSFYDMVMEAIENPTPHVVHYRAATNLKRYVPPKEFPLFRRGPSSPSDCEWHVPGTEKKDF